MKPVKKTKKIVIEYWDCGMKDHRHTTESGAQKCIDKQSRALDRQNKARRKSRITKKIIERFLNGESAAKLSREFGVSARTIHSRTEKFLRSHPKYDSRVHLELYRRAGSGPGKTARDLWERLKA